jgi:hypothetical protein
LSCTELPYLARNSNGSEHFSGGTIWACAIKSSPFRRQIRLRKLASTTASLSQKDETVHLR